MADPLESVAPAATVAQYTSPQALPAAIDYSASYISASFYAEPYTPGVCAAVCTEMTAYHRQQARAQGAASYTPCNYFNVYQLAENSATIGFYCAYHSASVDASYATLASSTYAGNTYTVSGSYAYSATVVDSGSF